MGSPHNPFTGALLEIRRIRGQGLLQEGAVDRHIDDHRAGLHEFEIFAGDELDSGLIDYIRELKQIYRIAMLSNAPSDARNSIIEKWHMDDAFDLIIISADVGLMKPDPAIYELTLEQLGFEPHETAFIDDFSENIKAARQLG
ncbi:MAG: HAD-IA family hydrolase, partial [Proteobacteria bacterium]|nr:HAD-IA family hydrolase [Pseudomonadota bacterium]